MPLHQPLPEPEDERVAALQDVLRGNGIGGPAPYTVEGEIAMMSNVGDTAISGRGWRRSSARLIALVVLVPFALALVGAIVQVVSHLGGLK